MKPPYLKVLFFIYFQWGVRKKDNCFKKKNLYLKQSSFKISHIWGICTQHIMVHICITSIKLKITMNKLKILFGWLVDISTKARTQGFCYYFPITTVGTCSSIQSSRWYGQGAAQRRRVEELWVFYHWAVALYFLLGSLKDKHKVYM